VAEGVKLAVGLESMAVMVKNFSKKSSGRSGFCARTFILYVISLSRLAAVFSVEPSILKAKLPLASGSSTKVNIYFSGGGVGESSCFSAVNSPTGVPSNTFSFTSSLLRYISLTVTAASAQGIEVKEIKNIENNQAAL
jgi:hypothetical protein